MTGPAGVILAGGLATRMGGGDKCLLPLGGAPMLEGIIARLQPQVSALALNANGDAARGVGMHIPNTLVHHMFPVATAAAALKVQLHCDDLVLAF